MNKKIYKILNEIKNDNFRREVEALILTEKDSCKILLKPFYLRHLVEILNMLNLDKFESGVIRNLEFFIENNLKYISKEDKFRIIKQYEHKNTGFNYSEFFPYKILKFKSKLNSNEGSTFHLLNKTTTEEFEIMTEFLSDEALRRASDFLTLSVFLNETRNPEKTFSFSMLIKILNITNGRILKENSRTLLRTINTAIEMNLYELFIKALKCQSSWTIDATSLVNLMELMEMNFEDRDDFRNLLKQIYSLDDKSFETFLEMLRRSFHKNIKGLKRTFEKTKLKGILNQYSTLKSTIPLEYHEEYVMNLLVRFVIKNDLFEREKGFVELINLLKNISLMVNVGSYFVFEKTVDSMITFYEKALNGK